MLPPHGFLPAYCIKRRGCVKRDTGACELDKLRYTPSMSFDISEEIIEAVILDPDATTKQHLQTIVHQIAAKYKLADSPQLFQLLEVYRNGVRDGKYANQTRILKLFRKRAVRSLSGVSVISLLTKFW